MNRVLLRQLQCLLRVPPIAGANNAILDTGAPLTVFPHHVWHHQFHWQAGQHYDELSVAGIGSTLRGQVLHHNYSFRLARLRVPVELAGQNLKGDRLRLDGLICQLAETGGPPSILLGLWGNALDGRRLIFDRVAGSDELTGRLEF